MPFICTANATISQAKRPRRSAPGAPRSCCSTPFVV